MPIKNELDIEIVRTLGTKCRVYRLAKGLTQRDLARGTGLSLPTISHFESGDLAGLSLCSFINILRALGQLKKLDVLIKQDIIR